MKPKCLVRTLSGVIAVFTLLAALISPMPAYANTFDGHEPPPPRPPSNDMGSGGKPGSPGLPDGKGGEATSAANAVAAPGTPPGLAALLSTGSLEPAAANLTLPFKVEFCPQASPDFFNKACQQEVSIEDIITYIQGLDNASGVIYVAQNYSTGATLPQPGLVFDQSTFTGSGPLLVTSLDVHGGYDSTGMQTGTMTPLNQPVTVQNFNENSQFGMDTFQINVAGYAAGDPATAAVNVINSNHVTLADLHINESAKGSGLVATQSNDLTLRGVSVLESGDGLSNVGVSISQTSKILLDQVGSTSTSRSGYGGFFTNNSGTLSITNSQFNGNTNDGVFVLSQDGDIRLDGVNAAINIALGAAFLLNTGGLSILNSHFDSNANEGLQVSSQAGLVILDTVTATGNASIGASFTSITGPLSFLNSQFNDNGAVGLNLSGDSGQVSLDGVTASGNHTLGTSIVNQSNGDVAILSSLFDNNGAGGLSTNVNGGAITLYNVSASSNLKSSGASLNSFMPAGSLLPGIQVTGGNFSGNGARGMQASSTGAIDITGASFLSNTTDGLALNGLNNQSAINLVGVQAISNGGIGTQVFFTGDVQVIASIFTGNVKGGLDLEYAYVPPPLGIVAPDSFTVTLDQVQAVTNAGYGALVNAGLSGAFPPVDLLITNSNFDQNAGTDQGGLAIDTFGSVNLDNVSASGNAGNGVEINSLDLFINNSLFNSNAGYGLALEPGGDAALVNVQACHNGQASIQLLSGTALFQNVNTTCAASASASEHAPLPAEAAGLPWQTITVLSGDLTQHTGRLSCQMGTTFVFLQKGTPPAVDQELARVDLPACITPEGSTAIFQDLAQAGLPAPLPDGDTFQGLAFDLAINAPANPGGALALHFSLPAGLNLPVGKKLAVLWFDPAANQWVELPTFAGANSAFTFPVKTGVFVLVLK